MLFFSKKREMRKFCCSVGQRSVVLPSPGIVEGVIPEQISYLECELVLKEILKRNGSIRNRIAIFEELEYQLLLTDLRSRCAQRQESVYAAAAEAILAKMNASAD